MVQHPGSESRTFCRLTPSGRIAALGGFDPVERWTTYWDGRWRMALFDVPETSSAVRAGVRRSLAKAGFGLLQNSVWIHPHAAPDLERWEQKAKSAGSFVRFEASPSGTSSNEEIVAKAWNFAEISRRYQRCLGILEQAPIKRGAPAAMMAQWATEEWSAFMSVLEVDPFLPKCLWPTDYLGERYYHRRQSVWRAVRDAEYTAIRQKGASG